MMIKGFNMKRRYTTAFNLLHDFGSKACLEACTFALPLLTKAIQLISKRPKIEAIYCGLSN